MEHEDKNEDPLLTNPYRTVGRIGISGLAEPREPMSKEWWVPVFRLSSCVVIVADRNRSRGTRLEGKSERQGYEGAQVGVRAYDLLIPVAFPAALCRW